MGKISMLQELCVIAVEASVQLAFAVVTQNNIHYHLLKSYS